MRHAPLITFDVDGEHCQIRTICPCSDNDTVRIPTGHLAAFAVAVVAACNALGMDMGDATATALLLLTVEERRTIEERYVEYLRNGRAAEAADTGRQPKEDA